MATLKFWLLYVYCLYYLAGLALSSHFQGGVIQWRPANPFNGTIVITHRTVWRRDHCTQATVNTQTLFDGESDLICRSGCSGKVGSMDYYCTDFSTIEGWSAGQRSYSYNAAGVTSFEASFATCCWIGNLAVVGNGRSWEIRVKGTLTARADTGSVNSSPISAISPIVQLQQGRNHTIRIPVADVDGDDVRCRWAESSQGECSGICMAFTGSTLVGCNLQYPATGAAGLYAVALQIEDFASTAATVPLSSVPLQFLVNVSNSMASCASGTQPEFVGVTRVDGSCVGVPSTYQELIIAQSGCSGARIIDILTASPIGLQKSNLTASTTAQKWFVDITWTPTSSQSGPNIFCYYALDSCGLSSPQSCITLLGGVQAPQLVLNSISPTGLSTNASQWSIQFDRQFRRPTSSRFIRIYDALSNTQVVAIDVSTTSSVTYPTTTSGRTLTFSTTYSFTQHANYYVLLDPGVALGTEFCGAESAAVRDPTFWTITIVVMVVLEVPTVEVPENIGTVTVCCTTSSGITEPLTAEVTAVQKATEKMAAANVDFTPASRTITFPISSTTTRSCTNFDIINDDIGLEGNESFTLQVGTTGPQTQVTIIDDDVVVIEFELPIYTIPEANGPVTVCLESEIEAKMDLEVTVTASEKSPVDAQDGVDFNSCTPRSVTFPAGVVGSTRCIEIEIIDDIIALENDEGFIVDFEFVNGMGVSKGAIPQATVVIIDNDVVVIEFERPIYTIPEANGTVTVCLESDTEAKMDLEVTVIASKKSPVDAQDGVDFNSSTPRSVTFPAGVVGSTRCIEIEIIDDIIALENDEGFIVDFEFVNGMGVSKGAIPQATVVIIDNNGGMNSPDRNLSPAAITAITAAFCSLVAFITGVLCSAVVTVCISRRNKNGHSSKPASNLYYTQEQQQADPVYEEVGI